MWPFTSEAQTSRNTISSKRARRAEALKHAPPFSADEHQKYLNATATQIVENIQAKVWTATVVLEAYLARAAQAQEVTNCLTEVFFEEAMEEASKLDAEFAKTGKLQGPMHGVPISVKDMFNVKGFDSTIGYTRWGNKPAEQDAAAVATLRAAGAIIIAKTNVPQTLLAFESSNPLWGRTLSPWSAAHSPGGSSGGEGVLLAVDGAALGVGSDVGGSIRIPSGYCGIYGLKPGHGRVSYDGSKGPNPGFEAVNAVAGPMGRSVADLERMSRVLFGKGGNGQDIFPAPVPYRDVTLPEKLRFGYYLNGSSVPSKALTVRSLEGASLRVTKLSGHVATEALRLFTGITSADGYEKLTEHLGPDKKESALFLVTLGARLPGFVRITASWVIRTFFGDEKFATCLAQSHKTTVRQYYNYVAEKKAFEKAARGTLWSGEPALDAVIAPVQAWRAGPGAGSKFLEHEMYGPKGAYDVHAMEGLPVGVQIVGEAWGEEKVLAIMHVVDAALGPRGFGPGSWTPEKQRGGALASPVKE
ncbi:amidase signature domain-containing protein [Lactarius quietus]|nr:amidase signature domain-containing protein [Lactarius quietus]